MELRTPDRVCEKYIQSSFNRASLKSVIRGIKLDEVQVRGFLKTVAEPDSEYSYSEVTMRLQKIQLLTGTTLALLVSAGSIPLVNANPVREIAQTQTMTTAATETIIGYVKSIVGEVVTIREEKAPYRTLRIERRILGITGLVPGMKVRATVARGSSVVQSLVVIPDVQVATTTATTRTTTTTTAPATTPMTRPTPAPRPVPTPRPAPVPRTTAPVPRAQPAAPIPTQPARPVRGLW
ncbi:MAG: autotransporter [Actinomycetota bacterium]